MWWMAKKRTAFNPRGEGIAPGIAQVTIEHLDDLDDFLVTKFDERDRRELELGNGSRASAVRRQTDG